MRKLLLTVGCAFYCLNISAGGKDFYKKGPNGQAIKSEKPKIYVDPATFYGSSSRYANMDTLFWDDFDSDTVINDINQGGPWLNLDLDGNIPNNPSLPGNYFVWENEFIYSILDGSVLDSTNVAASYSWMQNATDSNFNDLITVFGIPITKTGTILTLDAFPQQGPQWMDGFTLKVDTLSGGPFDRADTLIRHMQHVSGDGPLWDPTFVRYPADADSFFTQFYYDSTMLTNADSGDAIVVAHHYEFSLDSYVGSTIFIHFFHDSFDDVAVWFDNVGVFEPQSVGLDDLNNDFYMKAFPNPANDILRIELADFVGSNARIHLYSASGELVDSKIFDSLFGSDLQTSFEVSELPAGIYFVKTQIGQSMSTTKVVIQ